MKKSVITIKSNISSVDIAGFDVPAMYYVLYINGRRFGNICKSIEELQDTLICGIILENPDTSFDVDFRPLPRTFVTSFNNILSK